MRRARRRGPARQRGRPRLAAPVRPLPGRLDLGRPPARARRRRLGDGRDRRAAATRARRAATRTIVATSPVVPAPPDAAAATATATDDRAGADPEAAAEADPEAEARRTRSPPGPPATATPSSSPRSRPAAQASPRRPPRRRRRLGRGVAGVGVLTSGKFASLHPGYYVVFAASTLARRRADGRTAGLRRVSRTPTRARSRASARCSDGAGRGRLRVDDRTCPFSTVTTGTRLCNTPRKGVDWPRPTAVRRRLTGA